MPQAMRPGVPLLDEDYLILSTIHSAKGQEWRSVFVLNAIDGCIPSDLSVGSTSEIEEERRLAAQTGAGVARARAGDHGRYLRHNQWFLHSLHQSCRRR